jgi:hypothetical protein
MYLCSVYLLIIGFIQPRANFFTSFDNCLAKSRVGNTMIHRGAAWRLTDEPILISIVGQIVDLSLSDNM